MLVFNSDFHLLSAFLQVMPKFVAFDSSFTFWDELLCSRLFDIFARFFSFLCLQRFEPTSSRTHDCICIIFHEVDSSVLTVFNIFDNILRPDVSLYLNNFLETSRMFPFAHFTKIDRINKQLGFFRDSCFLNFTSGNYHCYVTERSFLLVLKKAPTLRTVPFQLYNV